MMKLTTFLGHLPGVRARLTSKRISAGALLSSVEAADIHIMHSALGPVKLVGYVAGTALRELYHAAQLPMEPGTSPVDTPMADEYLSDPEPIRREAAVRREIYAIAVTPNRITEADLENWHVLETVFRNQLGDAPGQLTIAGIPVTKIGGGDRFGARDISFLWTATDGTERHIKYTLKDPLYVRLREKHRLNAA